MVRIKMESKAAEASGKSAEQRRLERRQKAVIGKIYKKSSVRFIKKLSAIISNYR